MTFKIPEHIERIGSYAPGHAPEKEARRIATGELTMLCSNENPLGPSPAAAGAVREAAGNVHRYPDAAGDALREALSSHLRCDPGWIVLGNGSTELVELLAKAFLATGGSAIAAAQAFVMYHIAVRAMNAKLTCIPMVDHRHDLDRMAAACDASTSLVYIGNPNNPSGTYVTGAELDRFLDRVPEGVLTVLDEAYRDYVESSDYADGLSALRRGRRVVVLRTFSKIHGLAGLRIGYAITLPKIARALQAVRSPFNTSVIAQRAAIAALGDTEHVARSRETNARERRYLEVELRRRRIPFVPSVANFVLVHVRPSGEEVAGRLLSRGVVVRPMAAYGYPEAIRVSVGSRAETDRFLEALAAVLSTDSTLSSRSADFS